MDADKVKATLIKLKSVYAYEDSQAVLDAVAYELGIDMEPKEATVTAYAFASSDTHGRYLLLSHDQRGYDTISLPWFMQKNFGYHWHHRQYEITFKERV